MIVAGMTVGYLTESAAYAAGRFTHRSTAIFAPNRIDMMSGAVQKTGPGLDATLLKDVEVRGVKFGIKIKRSQSVKRFVIRSGDQDVHVAEQKEVSQELQKTFKADPGEKWVGFAMPPFRFDEKLLQTGVLASRYTISYAGVKSLPQPVPVVYAFENQRFRQHHIMGVVVLSKEMTKLETYVQTTP